LKQLISNLTQELLPASKIERDSILKLEQLLAKQHPEWESSKDVASTGEKFYIVMEVQQSDK
jgi:hypothetical protein